MRLFRVVRAMLRAQYGFRLSWSEKMLLLHHAPQMLEIRRQTSDGKWTSDWSEADFRHKHRMQVRARPAGALQLW